MGSKVDAGHGIVITGIAGKFPSSENIQEYRDNLMNKRDMISEISRWNLNHNEIPPRMGTMPHFEKYDLGHFGTHYLQGDRMCPMARNVYEKVCEALADAGINPHELVGTRTDIYYATCISDSALWFFEPNVDNRCLLGTGVSRSPSIDRIAHFLKVNGVAENVDTACSSSMYAVTQAYNALKTGRCDYAIVASCSLISNPYETLQFARLGVLSPDGSCKSFDASANGYVRSDAVCAFILQRAEDARRIYAEVVHAKTNCDGYKEEGITFPSTDAQQELLESFYNECGVDPSTVDFVEAHGTGTKAGDPVEAFAIDKVFTKNRKEPLQMGSVKSSIGHTEPAAGMCSIIKAIIGLREGCMPPNILYNKPNPEIACLVEGRVNVITESTPWPKDKDILIGVNSYGFGGANAHVLLRSYDKVKQKNLPSYYMPHLVYVSARTEEGVTAIIDDVRSRQFSVDYIDLINAAFRYNIPQHRYRGYAVITKDETLSRAASFCYKDSGALCLVFTDFGTEWVNIARDLCALSSFTTSVQNIHNILTSKGLDVLGTVYNKTDKTQSKISSYLGNFVIHVAITELLMQLELQPDYLYGSSIGIFSALYLDGFIQLEEAVHCAYLYSTLVWSITDEQRKSPQININTDFHKGNEEENTNTDVSKIMSHRAGLELIKYLKSIHFNYKSASKRLLTTAEANIDFVGFIINSLLEPVVHTSYLSSLPSNATVCNMGKSKNLPSPDDDLHFIHFSGHSDMDNTQAVLDLLGRLYMLGYNFNIKKLYGDKNFPVSKNTPMISHLIRWNHESNWRVPKFTDIAEFRCKQGLHHFIVNPAAEEYAYMVGHNIDNRILFPATGYVLLAWKAICTSEDINCEPNIVIRDLKFIRATPLVQGRLIRMAVIVRKSDGYFEIMEEGAILVTGWISKDNASYSLPSHNQSVLPSETNDTHLPMNEADFYKELRLRGYNYSGPFRSVKQYNFTRYNGLIQWQDNWVAFMDNMLQTYILQIDSRNLYVPTTIEKITIQSNLHLQYMQDLKEKDYLVPLEFCPESKILRCGGIEIKNPQASAISKQKPVGQPVLEKHVFLPNIFKLTAQDSVRVNIQIILENKVNVLKFKAVELHNETTKPEELLSPFISDALAGQPMITGEVMVLSNQLGEVRDAVVNGGNLSEQNDCLLVTAKNILSTNQLLQQCLASAKGGYILSREPLTSNYANLNNLDILTIHTLEHEKLYLLRQKESPKQAVVVKIDNNNFSWLPMLKQAIHNNNKVVMYAQNQPLCGIMGLYNCIRREPNCGDVRCVFVADQAPAFNPAIDFYKSQLSKDLAVNVYKNGEWGTYRHLSLDENVIVQRQHCFANVTTKGDLSSFSWIEGPLSADYKELEETTLVHVYYAALNFRDIMLTTGRLAVDVVEKRRTKQELVQGFEYAGRTTDGRRVMGMSIGALSTMILADRYLMTELPDEWSLEDAATVMVVYSTVLYAFKMKTSIKSGQSILIHAGSGGVGQAAIRVALYHGLVVYTTVGTQEKREFLKQQFPELKDCNIGNSRDTSFEKLVLQQTKGRGVDYVLNSLAEDKLQASIRCIANGGHFLEIGKFDLSNNSPLPMKFFAKNAAFHGVMLDCLFDSQPSEKKKIVYLLNEGITKGYVKPLVRKIFKQDEVEQAFRYMAAGKHIGKVLINIKKEEASRKATPSVSLTDGIPRYFCKDNQSYVITGGLGGFGLELADWLVLRGANQLVLNSRRGVRNGYQAARIRVWKSYGVNVVISTDDITTKEGCVQLLNKANALGPVAALYNLSVVLEDAILENQTEEKFQISFGPKAVALKYLDEVTRELCPDLRDFVAFSSVSCGRGNAGQTNYGMSNSVMERICEKRKNDGLPALAIQWGAIGEVGLVADMQEKHTEVVIGGTLQQKLSSCFNALDKFLRQSEPVVSSMIVAEKRDNMGSGSSMIECIANILGIRNMKSISGHTSLAELGMDSMMAVEIQQSLEREYSVSLTLQDIRNLTFEKLKTLQDSNESEIDGQGSLKTPLPNNAWSEDMFTKEMIELKSATTDSADCTKVFIIPGIGNTLDPFTKIASQLNGRTIYLQHSGPKFGETVVEIASAVYKTIRPLLEENERYILLTHSVGTIIGLEVIARLEKSGHKGEVVVIDGGVEFSEKMLLQNIYNKETKTYNMAGVAGFLKNALIPGESSAEIKDKIANCRTLNSAVEIIQGICPDELYKKDFLKEVIEDLYRKVVAFSNYADPPTGLQSNFVMYRPKQAAVADVQEDYKLSSCTVKPVPVFFIDGDHQTVLEQPDIIKKINELIYNLKTSN